ILVAFRVMFFSKNKEILLMTHVELVLLTLSTLAFWVGSDVKEYLTISLLQLIIFGFLSVLLSYLPLFVIHWFNGKKTDSD
ncbi:MAG: hypothetical protein ACSHWU_13165, partial [Marinicella sp.]